MVLNFRHFLFGTNDLKGLGTGPNAYSGGQRSFSALGPGTAGTSHREDYKSINRKNIPRKHTNHCHRFSPAFSLRASIGKCVIATEDDRLVCHFTVFAEYGRSCKQLEVK